MSEQETATPPPGPVVAVMYVYAKGSEFGFDIDTDLGPEVMGEILGVARDKVLGRDDRAAGAWGRR